MKLFKRFIVGEKIAPVSFPRVIITGINVVDTFRSLNSFRLNFFKYISKAWEFPL